MRLDRVELTRYGAFTSRSIDLGPGLTVVLGPNESGKSTFRHAVGDLVWGLTGRLHPYAFRFAPGNLCLGADVSSDSGTVVQSLVVDSRGVRTTSGDAVVPWWVTGSVTSRAAWEKALGLNLSSLREGTRAVIEGDGDLAPLVFRARTGVDLQAVRDGLQAEAEALYKVERRGARTVRARAAEVQALRDRVIEATSSADLVAGQRAALAAAQATYEAAGRELAEARTAEAVAERDLRALPKAHTLDATRRDRDEACSAGRVLDEDELAAHDRARTVLDSLESTRADLAARRERHEARLAESPAEPEVLEVEPLVTTLHGRSELAAASRDVLHSLTAELQIATGTIRRLLTEIAPLAVPPAEASDEALLDAARSALLPVDVVMRIDQLADDVETSATAAAAERAEADDALRRQRRAEVTDPTAPADLVEARAARDAAWSAVREPWLTGSVPEAPRRSELADDVDAAHRRLDDVTVSLRAHSTSLGRVSEIDEQVAERLEAADKADSAYEAVLGQWREVLGSVGVPAVLDPAAWRGRRDRQRELVEALAQHGTCAQKLAEAQDQVERFSREVAALGERLGESPDDPWVLLARVKQRVDRAGRAAAVRLQAQEDLGRVIEQEQEALRQKTAADAVLAGLERDDDVLDDVVTRSRTYLALAARADDQARELEAIAGDGSDADALVEALRDRTPVDVEEAVVTARTARQDAEIRYNEAHTGRAEATRLLEQAEARGDAASLAAQEGEAAERLAASVEDYLALRIQALILERVLLAESPESDNALVAHAEVLAGRLTRGRIQHLRVEETADGRRLRIDAESLVDGVPGELSEGTADQVFLALRLAGIREQQEASRRDGHETLPVLLDDVLQASDDDRTRAALEVLVEESRDQQIILLTHHTAVADLAAGLGAQVVRLAPLDLAELAAEAPAAAPRAARADGAPDPVAVRAWARENGVVVGDRGRIPKDVVAAYLARNAADLDDEADPD